MTNINDLETDEVVMVEICHSEVLQNCYTAADGKCTAVCVISVCENEVYQTSQELVPRGV